MHFLSLCSGIEAASVAFAPLGWKAAAVSEIDPFACAVLAHHYPHVPNLGDMRRFREWPVTLWLIIDAIVGGPPCQAFSLAGRRLSLADDRGNLTLIYTELLDHADRIRAAYGLPPIVALYENVPGLLSVKDNAFGCFLAGLAGEDVALVPPGPAPRPGKHWKWSDAGAVFGPARAIAWRLLDAQYFGLAQRRRRVFVVASAREGFDPAAVLFEFQGLRRDTAPSREAGQEVAGCLGASVGGSDENDAEQQRLIPHTVGALTAACGPNGHGGSGLATDKGAEAGHILPFDTTQITSAANYSNPKPGDSCHPLAAGAHPPAIAFPANLSSTQHASAVDIAPSLGALNPTAVAYTTKLHNTAANNAGKFFEERTPCLDASSPPPAVVRVFGGNRTSGPLEVAPSLTAHSVTSGRLDFETEAFVAGAQVRRLMPEECEPLQGFPVGYTAIPWPVVPDLGAVQCAKQLVRATVRAKNGRHYVATNYTKAVPGSGCPRAGLPSGEGYHLCRDVCGQQAHAEVNALALAGKRAKGGTLYIEGHTYACDQCLAAAKAAGIVEVVIGAPPTDDCPDGPRYKALGNSWPVPVVTWIGRRIQEALK